MGVRAWAAGIGGPIDTQQLTGSHTTHSQSPLSDDRAVRADGEARTEAVRRLCALIRVHVGNTYCLKLSLEVRRPCPCHEPRLCHSTHTFTGTTQSIHTTRQGVRRTAWEYHREISITLADRGMRKGGVLDRNAFRLFLR